MNLTIRKTNALPVEIKLNPKLSSDEKEIVKAAVIHGGTRCTDLFQTEEGEAAIHAKLSQVFEQATYMNGHKSHLELSEAEVGFMLTEMRRIVRRQKWVSIEEIEIICRRGLLGEYTEYTGFTPHNFNKWIEAYRTSSERVGAMRKQTMMLPPEKKEVDTGSRIMFIRTIMNSVRSKKALEIGMVMWIYPKLEEAEVIKLTKEEKLKLFKEEKAKYYAAHKLDDRSMSQNIDFRKFFGAVVNKNKRGKTVSVKASELSENFYFREVKFNCRNRVIQELLNTENGVNKTLKCLENSILKLQNNSNHGDY